MMQMGIWFYLRSGTMKMSKDPEKWEVWFANVRYEDNPTIVKQRPVIIYDKQEAFIISLAVILRGWDKTQSLF